MVFSEYYIYKYWVGLLDGAGEIQVNHWRYEYLQYRIVIRLKANIENQEMLLLIKKQIKGFVEKDPKNADYILWYEMGTRRIEKFLLPLLKRYPLINTKVYLQYLFLIHCMSHKSVSQYLQERPYKYNIPIVLRSEEEIFKAFYFPVWLAGYLEAVGLFILRDKSSKEVSFAVKEKNNYFLISSIRSYFGFPNKIRELKDDYFELEINNKYYLTRIINQGVEFPFLGHKKVLFKKFEECVMSSYHCELI
jgi:hypothetical protein